MAGRRARQTATRPEASVRSRARAIPAASTVGSDRAERVEHIARLMASNLWRSGITNRELVAAWGVSLDTMKDYAAEASRIVRRDLGDSEEIRARAMVALEQLAVDCRSLRKKHPSYVKAAVDAIGLMTGLGGCPPVTRTEVTGKDGAPMVGAEDVRRMAEEVLGGAK